MTNPSILNSSKTQKHDDIHLWLYEKDNQISVIKACGELPENTEWPEKWNVYGFRYDEDSSKKTFSMNRLIKSEFEILNVKREVPIYSKNYKSTYLQGICDAIISFKVKLTYEGKTIPLKEIDWPRWIDVPSPTGIAGRVDRIRNTEVPEKFDYKYDDEHYYTLERDRKETFQYIDSYECDVCNKQNSNIYCRIIVEFKPELKSISGIMGQIKVYRDCIGPSHLVIVTYDQNTKYDNVLLSEGIKIIRILETE